MTEGVYISRILVLGGSRFAGRVFSILAASIGQTLHAANRGHFPLAIDGVNEYICDRRLPRRLSRILPEGEYDAAVDFCAMRRGDIEGVIRFLGSRIKQYVLISCAGVYAKTPIKSETSPLISEEDSSGNLVAVEKELIQCAARKEITYTILRPARIYGEYNNNTGEGSIIEHIAKRHVIPMPADATANFNFIYVRDLARAILQTIGDERAFGKIFNIAQPIRVTYNRLFSDFERYSGGAFETHEITVDEIERQGYDMPFPLTEDDIVDGTLFRDTFDFEFTPFSEGMESTFKAIAGLYGS